MIALITPTGARPNQFNICEKVMKAQTYPGKVVWIIVDDYEPRSTDNIKEDFREGWTIHKVYPRPLWQLGLNTQGRNISVGINTLLTNYYEDEIEAIFIIEDDDYYRPIYLEEMTKRLNGFLCAGETNTIYYNVLFRYHVVNPNVTHASLFQVVFIPEAVSIFRMSLGDKFIDARFFQILDRSRVNLFHAGTLAVGIKGMGGRPGIGAGHRKMITRHNRDHNLVYLQNLIGIKDAQLYDRYYGAYGM